MEGRSFGVDAESVLEVAERTGCSEYDSEFITLAEQLNIPLVTYDEKILRRCRSIARKPW
jgi:predicted nucleic acid-binding protein